MPTELMRRRIPIAILTISHFLALGCGEARTGDGDAGAPFDSGVDGAAEDLGPDAGGPSLTILRPSAGDRLGGTVPVIVRVAGGDAEDLTLSADDSTVAGPTDAPMGDAMLTMDAEALDEGAVTLVASALIDGEVVESPPVEVTIQWRGPEVTIDGVPTMPVPRGQAVELTLSCSSETCTYDCRLDEGSFEPCGPTVLLEELSVGEHRIQVVADDERGRTTVPPAEASWRVAFAWADLAIGARGYCGISSGGALFCWGATDGGRTGTGSTDPVVRRPTRLEGTALFDAVSVERFGVGSTGCASRQDGALLCWGAYPERPVEPVPRVVDADLGAEVLSVGGRHLCAIDGAGALHCGGANEHGQLGRNTGAAVAAPLALSDQTRVWTDVSVGATHTLALAEGALWCFGDNGAGACGTGDTDPLTGIAQVGSATDWTAISAGPDYGCGIRGGRVYCWGDDAGGRLGEAPTGAVRTTPVEVVDEDGFVDVSVGERFACAARDDGRVWCWGEDDRSGTMGRAFAGPRATVFAPGPVETMVPATGVVAGATAACLTSAVSGVHCWGAPATDLGDLGLANPSALPTVVAIDDRWHDLAITSTHGCGILAMGSGAGALYCWGLGDDGQLGLDDRVARAAPERVGDAIDWVQVEVAPGQTCARRADERLYCWGDDSHGELGVGGTGDRALTPERVDGRYTAIAVSASHGCGIRGGGLWCWGANADGQLGLGDGEDRSAPARVGDGSDWAWVAVTEGRSCGSHLDGRIDCWGLVAQSPASRALAPQAVDVDVSVFQWVMGASGDALIDEGRNLQLLDRRGATPTLSGVPIGPGAWESIALLDERFCGLRDGSRGYCADAPFDGLSGEVLVTDALNEWQQLFPLPAERAGGSGCAVAGPVRVCWGSDARSLHGRGYGRWIPTPLRVPRD